MDQGITWDEPTYVQAGIIYVNNLMHLNFNSNAYQFNMEHPPVSKYIYGIALWLFNGGKDNFNAYVVAKTISALMGAATCAIVYLIGREFFSKGVGVVSAIILALIPDFVAHTQIAAIDGPVAFFFTLTMYLFMIAMKTKSRGYFIASAISLGLLVDTKFTGYLALPVMGLFFLSERYLVVRKIQSKKANFQRVNNFDHYFPLKFIISFFLIAAATAIIIYPWIWGGIGNIEQTLAHWSGVLPKYFLGTVQVAPLDFYPIYFLVTTPDLLFIPLLLGAFYIIQSKDAYKWVLLIWLIVPFAYDLGSFKQDGMRYILMIYPALAMVCGVGIEAIANHVQVLAGKAHIKQATFAIVSAIVVLYLLITLALTSPYYLDYYNMLSGGPSNADKNDLFDIGWWGEGIYDSVMYVENNAPPGSTVFLASKPTHVVAYYSSKDKYIVPGSNDMTVNNDADYIITNTWTYRYCTLNYTKDNYALVHVSTVQGTPIAEVLKKVS